MNTATNSSSPSHQILLRVVAPHFVAGATWERVDGVWRCTRDVAPIIAWMRKWPAQGVHAYLTKKGWTYTWHPIS